jgi:hypothetical protein
MKGRSGAEAAIKAGCDWPVSQKLTIHEKPDQRCALNDIGVMVLVMEKIEGRRGEDGKHTVDWKSAPDGC